jgi:hypothetical protein
MKARMMISPDDAAVLTGDAADQDLAIVEQVELAGELAIAVNMDHALGPASAGVRDLDRAMDDHEEVDRPLAAREKMRAGRELLDQAEAGDAIELFLRQLRKGLCLAVVGVGRIEPIVVIGHHRSPRGSAALRRSA